MWSRSCQSLFSDVQRKEVWEEFWALDYSSRRCWILSKLLQSNVKRRTKKDDRDEEDFSNRIKQCSWSYFLRKVPVCKAMFLSTIGYKSDKILTVTRKSTAADKRGKTSNKNAVSQEVVTEIKEHIHQTYEPTISHYRRPHAPHRLYVDSSLTQLDMYSHYKDTFTLAGASRIVSRPTFARIVKDMNISFAKLGCELCETCLLYEQHNPKGTQCGSTACDTCDQQRLHVERAKVKLLAPAPAFIPAPSIPLFSPSPSVPVFSFFSPRPRTLQISLAPALVPNAVQISLALNSFPCSPRYPSAHPPHSKYLYYTCVLMYY